MKNKYHFRPKDIVLVNESGNLKRKKDVVLAKIQSIEEDGCYVSSKKRFVEWKHIFPLPLTEYSMSRMNFIQIDGIYGKYMVRCDDTDGCIEMATIRSTDRGYVMTLTNECGGTPIIITPKYTHEVLHVMDDIRHRR